MTRRTKIILSLIVGVAVVGGVWYYYKRSKENKAITKSQKENRNIQIVNTDV